MVSGLTHENELLPPRLTASHSTHVHPAMTYISSKGSLWSGHGKASRGIELVGGQCSMGTLGALPPPHLRSLEEHGR